MRSRRAKEKSLRDIEELYREVKEGLYLPIKYRGNPRDFDDRERARFLRGIALDRRGLRRALKKEKSDG